AITSMQVEAMLPSASETKTAMPSRARMSAQIRSARAAGSALRLTSDARNSASMEGRSEVLANRASGIWLPSPWNPAACSCSESSHLRTNSPLPERRLHACGDSLEKYATWMEQAGSNGVQRYEFWAHDS